MGYEEGQVICNSRIGCKEEQYCGGAKPHHPCSECDKCTMNTYAKCIPLEDSGYAENGR